MNGSRAARLKATVAVVLGVALLAAPLWLPALHHADETSYRYEATELAYDAERGLHLPGSGDLPLALNETQVACLHNPFEHPSQACVLNSYVRRQGLVDPPPAENVSDVRRRQAFAPPDDYRYVYLNDTFYRPDRRYVADGMQPVLRTANDTAALRAVAPPVGEAGPAYVTAAGTGNATVHGRHLAEGLYRRDGTYYSLALAETHRPEPAWGLWYPVLALAGVVVGLDLLRVAARAAGLQVRVGAD